jgi:HK97 family phage portal protein
MVVTFLARNIAQLGLPLYQRNGDADRERLQDHPLARLLRQPNPWTTRYRFINARVHDFAIHDVAYLLKTKVDGSTVGLVRLPPMLVTPKGDNWLTPEEFEVAGTKSRKRYPADQVVYFRGYGGGDGIDDSGVSPLESLRQTLREEWTGSQMREQIMRNGARVSGYLERPAGAQWSDGARDRFRTQWRAQYVGDGGAEAGGTPILEDGMTFKPSSQTAKDLQYVEGRKLTREEVAAAYFIPPPMVGILDKATFSNITEQRKMLYTDALGPWLTMIQDEISLQLIPDFEPANPQDFYVEFNLREKLTGDFVTRQDAITKAVGGPTMTVNEARALDNRPPIEGGDELIRPLNVTQNGDQNPIPAEAAPTPDMTPTPQPDDNVQED